jgi:hypothetical protein
MSADQRQAKRRAVGYPGFVPVVNCGIRSLLLCMIEDASAGGARLTFRTTRDVPDRFGLRLSPTAQTEKSCRVVWRQGDSVGVVFDNDPDTDICAI